MRALAASLVVLAGCAEISGLGSLEVCDGACVDATTDVTTTPDAPQDSPVDDARSDVADGSTVIGDGNVDAPATMECKSPKDCNTTNNYCCATVNTVGNYPQCQIANVTSKCQPSCTTALGGNQKCETDTVRLCSQNADCTENLYNRCCKFTDGDGSVLICTNLLIADAGGATCL